MNICLKSGKRTCKLHCGITILERECLDIAFHLQKLHKKWKVGMRIKSRYSSLLSIPASYASPFLYVLHVHFSFSFHLLRIGDLTNLIRLPCIAISIFLPLLQALKWNLYTEPFCYSSHNCISVVPQQCNLYLSSPVPSQPLPTSRKVYTGVFWNISIII